MMFRAVWITALLFANFAIAAEFTCPATKPPDPPFVPPPPYEAIPDAGHFWYGSASLWTALPNKGVWSGLPYEKDQGYGNKLFLWKAGYDRQPKPQPDIILVVKRLDQAAPLVSKRGGTNARFSGTWQMLTGVSFPTAGCWEVTVFHAGNTLTFVLAIQP